MAKDIQYDPGIIQKLANKLYAQADSVVAAAALLGLIVGGVTGYLFFHGAGAIVGAVVFCLIGGLIGQVRAFALRLQAQQALCQMYIEANTRRG